LNASAAASLIGRKSGRDDHFGMEFVDVLASCKKLKVAGIQVDGIHCFGGSNSWSKNGLTIVEAMKECLPHMERELGYAIRVVNLGGGFSGVEEAEEYKVYSEAIHSIKEKYQIMHEAGRAVFRTAGVFVSRVTATKRIGHREYVVCDGGMAQNFLLCRTEAGVRFYSTPRHQPCRKNGGDILESAKEVTVVGSSCNHQDVIGRIKKVERPIIPEDYMIFENCGAYHSTYTVSPFLGLKPAIFYILP
jgi:diaminopimelate decarboxylase